MNPAAPKPPSLSQLSKTPSWISIGFLLGALFVWLLPSPEPIVIEVPVKSEVVPPLVATRTQPDFSELEAVFALWNKPAVWANDLTEVALWDIEAKQYSRFYEVRRSGEQFYYRSIFRLTPPHPDPWGRGERSATLHGTRCQTAGMVAATRRDELEGHY